jgi:hypothetical protein
LRLQLDAGDMLEQPVERGDQDGPRRSPGLIIGVIVTLVAVAGAGIWYGMSGSSDAPAAEVPPTRNDMQPAETVPAQPPTGAPAAAAPLPGAAPATGATPPPSALPAQAAVPPAAATPSAAPARGDDDERRPGAAAAEPTKKTEPRARGRKRAGAKAAAPVSDDVAAAREALRNLQTGGPVLKVQPSEEIPTPDEGPSLAPPPPPEPPPPDIEE